MCIRDSNPTGSWNIYAFPTATGTEFFDYPHAGVGRDAIYICLLYTSDAADEGSSVDLGGRRIIKKKRSVYIRNSTMSH